MLARDQPLSCLCFVFEFRVENSVILIKTSGKLSLLREHNVEQRNMPPNALSWSSSSSSSWRPLEEPDLPAVSQLYYQKLRRRGDPSELEAASTLIREIGLNSIDGDVYRVRKALRDLTLIGVAANDEVGEH